MHRNVNLTTFQQREHVESELADLHWHGVLKRFEGGFHVILIFSELLGCRHKKSMHQAIFCSVGAAFISKPRRKEVAEIIYGSTAICSVSIDVRLISPSYSGTTSKGKIPAIGSVGNVCFDLFCC